MRGDPPITTAIDEQAPEGIEVFDPPPTRRPFSAADVVRLLVGLALIAVGTVVARSAQATVEGIEEDLLRAFARLPDTFESLVLSLAQLVTSLIPLVTLVVLLVRRHWKVALLLVATGAVATVAMAVAEAAVVDRDLTDLLDELRVDNSSVSSAFPDSRTIASTVALVTVAAPWLSRGWKRTLWWGVGALVVLRLLAVAVPAFDLVVALGVGLAVGSLILVLFGSPNNEPGPDELVAALVGIGVRPRRVERGDPVGSTLRYSVTDADGVAYDIALRTPDERDADLLSRAWRGLRFRASEVGAGFSTLKRRLEHEALVLVLAERSGVRVPGVVRLGTTRRGSAFLLSRQLPHRPLEPEDLTDPRLLTELWTQVRHLHDAGVAHRHLALESITVDADGRPWLHRFDEAQTAPSERERARDVAELLAETALVLGAPAAVTAAVEVLGPVRVAPALRMLQPLALPTSTRARTKQVDGLLQQLRDEVNAATGEPGLELEDLERIKPRTVLMVVAGALAFYTLLPQFANLSDTVEAFGNAEPGWIVGTMVFSALTYLFAAVSFQGAVADPVPFGPNLRVQVASSFAGLVGPAGAGGLALTARFLQRIGVGAAEAGASVAVDALGGFAVHVALLVGFVLWTGQSEDIGGFSLPDSSTVLLVLAVVFALVGVLAAIGPVRQRVLVPAWATVRTGLGQIGQVFTRPSRVIALFGGSAGISLTYVMAMFCAIEAFGGGLGLAQVGTAYLAGMAIATLAPTPGGLGAVESALIAGFTGFGLADPVAVSAVLTFRLATFWIPILPGWATLGWMQRNDEL